MLPKMVEIYHFGTNILFLSLVFYFYLSIMSKYIKDSRPYVLNSFYKNHSLDLSFSEFGRRVIHQGKQKINQADF